MATVLILNGRHEGEWYTIGAKPLVMGRDETLLAEIIDPRVSRRHLEVAQDPGTGKCWATDLGSRNGTKLNGQKMERNPSPLKEGDVVQIGHTMMVFTEREFEDADAAEKFRERVRGTVSTEIEKLDEREQYTEAAALFSRIFGKRRKG